MEAWVECWKNVLQFSQMKRKPQHDAGINCKKRLSPTDQVYLVPLFYPFLIIRIILERVKVMGNCNENLCLKMQSVMVNSTLVYYSLKMSLYLSSPYLQWFRVSGDTFITTYEVRLLICWYRVSYHRIMTLHVCEFKFKTLFPSLKHRLSYWCRRQLLVRTVLVRNNNKCFLIII